MGDDHTSKNDDARMGRDAFIGRIEAILDPAYRLATVILLDHAAAEDVVHDATVRAWRYHRRLRGDVTNFRTWFLAIVVAECRRARLRRLLRLRGRRSAEAAPEDVDPAIVQLDAGARAALFCDAVLELPLDEVARVLNLSPPRARARVRAAERRLYLAHREEPASR